MRDTFDTTAIQPGWDVYGSDDEHLGTIDDVGDSYLVIQKGMFFPKDIYVPFDAVVRADENGVVLNVPKGQLESMGWSEPPVGLATDSWASNATPDTYSETAGDTAGIGTERERIALHEEELEARKTTRQAGQVEVRKNVVEDEQSFEVPVAREEVRIRRVPAGRDASADAGAFTQDGDTIRVPVMEEDVEVTKRPVVREEIEIEKVVRQDTKRVSDTVRREEVDVDGDASVTDDRDTSPRGTGIEEDADYRR